MTTDDAHVEAQHLRELIARACDALRGAGFEGQNLGQQLEAALISVREVEELRRELARRKESAWEGL